MSQHDMDVANGAGVVVRADINAALQALASLSSGPSAPSPSFPCQLWADTGTSRLMRRNAANSAWVDEGPLDAALRDAASQGEFAADTGAANACVCNFVPAITARSESTPLRFKVANANSGASTINDGVGTVALVGATHAALIGGELVANGIALIQWNASVGGSGAYVLLLCTGAAGPAVNQVQTAFTTAGTSPAFTLTPAPALGGYAANQRFRVKFNAAAAASGTLNVSGLGAKNLKQYTSTGAKVSAVIASGQLSDVEYDGTDMVVLDPLPTVTALPFKYYSGFDVANNSGAPNTTIDVGPGSARDSTNAVDINLSSTFSGILQASGAWAAGTGQNKLDTGAKAISSTYHVFSIRKTSDGSGDILFSLSPTAPTMPSGYSGFQYIAPCSTDASGNIRQFKYRGDGLFDHVTPIVEVTAGPVAPATALLTLTGLAGGRITARLQMIAYGDAAGIRALSTDQTDSVMGVTEVDFTGGLIVQAGGGSSTESGSGEFNVSVDTSSQVRVRTVAAGNIRYRIQTNSYKVNR